MKVQFSKDGKSDKVVTDPKSFFFPRLKRFERITYFTVQPLFNGGIVPYGSGHANSRRL